MQKLFHTKFITLFLALVLFIAEPINALAAMSNESEGAAIQPIALNEIFIFPEQLVEEPPPAIEIEEDVADIEDAEILSDADVELIALVTIAEAEGECEEGKRLVIDTILNRVDSEHFPNTVHDVIYQRSQFSSMWNGRVDRCEVRDDICQLVQEELNVRTNDEVMFFTAGNYSKYGTPMFQVQNHYFSSYT